MTTTAPAIGKTAESIERNGFAIAEDGVSRKFIDFAHQAIDRAQPEAPVRRRQDAMYAIRNLLHAVPLLRQLIAASSLPALMRELLAVNAFITRAILFDKNDGANWAVPWHQDTTIAVRRRIDTPGFGPWSVKNGVVHVQPPAHVLEHVLTARIHLDDCDERNGALKVIAGSHRRGILDQQQIARMREAWPPTLCSVPAGGVLLMRPLLLHASSRANIAARRRIIHLEFAKTSLPHGLQWHEE